MASWQRFEPSWRSSCCCWAAQATNREYWRMQRFTWRKEANISDCTTRRQRRLTGHVQRASQTKVFPIFQRRTHTHPYNYIIGERQAGSEYGIKIDMYIYIAGAYITHLTGPLHPAIPSPSTIFTSLLRRARIPKVWGSRLVTIEIIPVIAATLVREILFDGCSTFNLCQSTRI